MPTVRPTTYIIEPTGYDTFVNPDKDAWLLYVVDGGTEYGWSIRCGQPNSSRILTRKGQRKFDDRRYIAHWRFPRDEAIEIATRHVDTLRVMGYTAQEGNDVHIAYRVSQDTAP